MRTRLPTSRDVRRWATGFEEALGRGTDEARAWLATPQGRRLRLLATQALIITTPVMLRSRFFKTPVGRLIEVAGGAALLVKLAEMLRDWELEPPTDT